MGKLIDIDSKKKNSEIDFKKLSKVHLSKVKFKKDVNLPRDLRIDITWTELARGGDEITRGFTFDRTDKLTQLTPEGRTVMAEYCLSLLSMLAYTDLNLGAKIRDKIVECLKDD